MFASTLTALQDLITDHMAMVCPVCRKNIAKKFKRDFPQMVVNANGLAREAGAKFTCH